jgi:predicted acylesterase/phospholipase RssA
MQFTSYPSRGSSDLLRTTKIWEVARATSAASSFFDPIKIGKFGEEFVDGATGANNPVRAMWSEAKHVFLGPRESLESNLKCLVSIGTGVPSLEPFGDKMWDIARTLKRIATETRKTAESFHQEHSELDEGNQYFRFNVPHGLEKIGLEDAAVMNQMRLCGKNLMERESTSSYTWIDFTH